MGPIRDSFPAMNRTIPYQLLAITALLIAGCDGSPPWRGDTEQERVEARPDFGAAAAYDRHLLFLGPGGSLPTAAIFDFAALSDSVGLRRGMRARLLDSDGWTALIDEAWEMPSMREPWRLLPHGALRMVVGDAGDVDALVYQGELDLRLEPGATVAEHSPDAGTQLVLRQAHLILDGDLIPGLMLDAQLGRAVNPASVPPPGAVTPTPAARAGAEALLVDNSGFYAVLGSSASGELAWIHNGGRNDVRRGARLEAIEWDTDPESGLRTPARWRVTAPGESLTGELVTEAADHAPLEGRTDVASLGYVAVSGWLEERGARRNVVGLIRQIR